MLLFRTASEARDRLGAAAQCEVCGAWSAVHADDTQGAIVGPRMDDAGTHLVCRICNECDELDENTIRHKLHKPDDGLAARWK